MAFSLANHLELVIFDGNRKRYWVTRRREVPLWLSRLATSRATRLIAHLVTLLFTTNSSLFCTFINCIMAFSLQFYMNYTAGKIKLQRKSQPAVDGGHILKVLCDPNCFHIKGTKQLSGVNEGHVLQSYSKYLI